MNGGIDVRYEGVLRRLRAARRGGDAGVAMVTAVLMIMILAGLSMAVLAVIVAQVAPTQFAEKNTRSVYAAEAGIEAALSQFRTAEGAPDATGAVYGQKSKLVCNFSGTVAADSGPLTYAVTIRYYRNNPAGKSDAWLTSNAMSCTNGVGPASQPSYAEIVSAGNDEAATNVATTSGDRKMKSIYRFQTTNTNVKGGYVYTFGDGYCLRAVATTAGSAIQYIKKEDCGDTANQDRELWLYDTDYKLKLASTLTGSATAQCITSPDGTSVADVGQAFLQDCVTDSGRWRQLWSWEGGSRWNGENKAITNYSSRFLGAKDSTVSNGAYLWVLSTGASDQPWGSFDPSPSVGAGAASYGTQQIVNYAEFGRCFDVTNNTVSGNPGGDDYEIVYPCKQDPSGGSKLNWNHKWYYTEPSGSNNSAPNQQIYILNNNSASSKYCLYSPGTNGALVYLTSACNAADTHQKFTRWKDTGDYTTSYTFTDSAGLCVTLSPDKYNGWTKIAVATCTGGLEQKWNAPPDAVAASIGNYQEVVGG